MAMNPLHAAVGMGIAKLIPIPWISLPLAFLSHILLDLYPEWTVGSSGVKNRFSWKEYGWKDKVLIITQVVLGLAVIGTLIVSKSWILLFAALLANLMDMWDGIYERITKKTFWFVHRGWFPFKLKSSWQGFAMKPLNNAVLDTIFVLLMLALIL